MISSPAEVQRMALEETLPTLLENLPCPRCLHSRFWVARTPDPLWNHRAYCCFCEASFPLTTRPSALQAVAVSLRRRAGDGVWRLEFVADFGPSGRYILMRRENGLIRWGFLSAGRAASADALLAAS